MVTAVCLGGLIQKIILFRGPRQPVKALLTLSLTLKVHQEDLAMLFLLQLLQQLNLEKKLVEQLP